MKRYLLILSLLFGLSLSQSAMAQYYSVNFDTRTVAAMVSSYASGTAAEAYYNEQIKQIMDHYTAAELSTAGIFATKFFDRRAYTDLGLWSSSTENYYYRRIYNLVSSKIMPKIWTVGGMMLKSPHNALNWGSYLMKVCDDTKSLCLQFESVVTNSTLSFGDISFLQLNPQVAQLLDLSHLGGVNFEAALDRFGNVGSNFTKENLKADMDNLYRMGLSLAMTGADNFVTKLLQSNNFNNLQKGNILAAKNIVNNYSDLFHTFDHGIGQGLLSLVGGEQALAGLFDISDYNLTSWIDDYARESKGQYYTQRWYIYSKDTGSEVVCNYNPPTGKKDITDGNHWYRFSTKDENFSPSSSQREAILQNSEARAGWSRSRISQLNTQSSEVQYSMNRSMLAYRINNIWGNQKEKAYAYSITVTKYWDRSDTVYETIFDSYSMSEEIFKQMLNLRLSELNNNDEGTVYYLGSDAKRYYQTTDAERLEGVETATISVICNGGAKLAESSTQYKCRQCGSYLSAHTRECAMRTTADITTSDTEELQAMRKDVTAEILQINTEISRITARNRQISKELVQADASQGAALRQEMNQNYERIEQLNARKSELEAKQKDIDAAIEEAENDSDNTPTDDYNRIPAIMNKLKADFNLSWKDNGSWSGYTFTRKASIQNIRGDITFKASLSIVRKPKYFLGIKFLRAIVKISWTLTTDYSDTSVIEVIELDPDMDAKEKEKLINEKIAEVARTYPDCSVSVEYARSEPLQTDNTEDTYHLLWSCDRLEIAREIDTRLTRIYSDLVALEKMMNYKQSIIDVLKQHAPYLNVNQGRKQSIVEECHERWMLNASSRKREEQP